MSPTALTPDTTIFQVIAPVLPICGERRQFPVRRIYCIGRNYAAHAREMGSDPSREAPFFFQKPSDAVQVCPAGTVIDHPYPSLTNDYHHEIEMVVVLGSGGRDIPMERALDHVYGYAVGLDMTRRDLQAAAKSGRKPWEIGKSFDRSAPIGPVHRVTDIGHPERGAITLSVNGTVRQAADLSDMIWSVAEQIARLSAGSELFAGDIIFSGTPENVGPVVVGDVMVGSVAGLQDISIRIV